MDEPKTEEETKQEPATEDTGERDKSTTTPLIDIANAAAERMENANKETERLQAVQAERDQRIALGGRSQVYPETTPKEETPEEYTERFLKGEVNPLKDDGVK